MVADQASHPPTPAEIWRQGQSSSVVPRADRRGARQVLPSAVNVVIPQCSDGLSERLTVGLQQERWVLELFLRVTGTVTSASEGVRYSTTS
jgi:hypothetical protein